MPPEALTTGSGQAGPARNRASTTLRPLRTALLRWYRLNRRDLPWRRTADPYAIWVSEIMLQQTQVATVLPYYQRFLDRFPDPASLAKADEERVLAAWSGLGYYRRARSLQAGAREVIRRHGGRVPDDPAALRELPGIGRYTAGAIASIAFGREEPILDGNVRRVLARLFAIPGRDTATDTRLWQLAGDLVRGPDPGDLNQALMELGAVVCTPRAPACDTCPMSRRCDARKLGTPEAFPEAKPRPEVKSVEVAVAWVQRRGRILLERPDDNSPLRGTWDLPAIEGSCEHLSRALKQRHGLTVRVGSETAQARHGIMNRRLTLTVAACALQSGAVARNPSLTWANPSSLREHAVSGATLKVARAVNATGGGRPR